MKAAFQNKFGSPEVLSVREVDLPKIAKHELLIKVRASPVTQGDRRLRAADYPGISRVIGRLMFGVFAPKHSIPGTNFSGTIVAIGDAVTQFSIGDDVFGGCFHSACAEYLKVPEDSAIAKLPAKMSHAEAAAVPYGAMTALQFLRDIAKAQEGEKVLIVGAAGGVGRFAVQQARHMGAHVTAVCKRQQFEMVRQLGAHEVIDYQAEDYQDSDKSYDVIFDTHSQSGFKAAKSSLTSTGRFVTVYLNLLVLLQIFVSAISQGPKLLSGVALGSGKMMRDVAELLNDKSIWPVVAERYSLSQVQDAHRALEDHERAGTIVVCIPSPPAV